MDYTAAIDRKHLRDLIAAQPQGEDLSTLTRAELDRRMCSAKSAADASAELGKPLSDSLRLTLWNCSVEYTRRGVPPVFRALPDPYDDSADQIADLFAIDLQWLAATRPDTAPLFSRWRGIFSEATFHQTSDWIASNYPRKQIHWFCNGLSLAHAQQRELHIIKTERVRKELKRLDAEREQVRATLATMYHQRDARHKTDNHKATIDRRVSIWFAGSLADWSPTLTARYYEAQTGAHITRQLADKIARQVRRDLKLAAE